MKFVLALIAALALAPAALAGDNHPKPCTLDNNGVPNVECQITGGGNAPDQR